MGEKGPRRLAAVPHKGWGRLPGQRPHSEEGSRPCAVSPKDICLDSGLAVRDAGNSDLPGSRAGEPKVLVCCGKWVLGPGLGSLIW